MAVLVRKLTEIDIWISSKKEDHVRLKQMQLNQQLHLRCVDWTLNLYECHNVFLSCTQWLNRDFMSSVSSRLLLQNPLTRDKRLLAMDQTHFYLLSNISQTFHPVHASEVAALSWFRLWSSMWHCRSWVVGRTYGNHSTSVLSWLVWTASCVTIFQLHTLISVTYFSVNISYS